MNYRCESANLSGIKNWHNVSKARNCQKRWAHTLTFPVLRQVTPVIHIPFAVKVYLLLWQISHLTIVISTFEFPQIHFCLFDSDSDLLELASVEDISFCVGLYFYKHVILDHAGFHHSSPLLALTFPYAGFMSNWHKLQYFGEREPQVGKSPYQISLACEDAWSHFLWYHP